MSTQLWPECSHCMAQMEKLTPFEGQGFRWVTVTCEHCKQKFDARLRHDAMFEMFVPGVHA